MVIIRYILICLIAYIIIRSLVRYWEEAKPSTDNTGTERKNKTPTKKVSKGIGEYIDYEEIKK